MVWSALGYQIVISGHRQLCAWFCSMWLIYRASRWRLKRRVANLESNLQQANDTIENLKHVPEPIMEDVPALPDAE